MNTYYFKRTCHGNSQFNHGSAVFKVETSADLATAFRDQQAKLGGLKFGCCQLGVITQSQYEALAYSQDSRLRVTRR
ncbi:MAG: hypothetical protein ACYDHF_08030 [Candidatus Cryosericum sp.]